MLTLYTAHLACMLAAPGLPWCAGARLWRRAACTTQPLRLWMPEVGAGTCCVWLNPAHSP